MKKLRLFIAATALMFGLGGLVPALASADTAKQAVCQSLGSNGDCTSDPAGGGVKINSVITAVVNILSFVVGLAAVIMIVVGGFKMITSGGDSSKVASGRSTVIYAIIGLIVAVFAQAIVYFVLKKLK